jgi:PD-(D/E)XK endonuclease
MLPPILVELSPLAETPFELRLTSWALIAPLAEAAMASASRAVSEAAAEIRLLREAQPVPGPPITKRPMPQPMQTPRRKSTNRTSRYPRPFRHTLALKRRHLRLVPPQIAEYPRGVTASKLRLPKPKLSNHPVDVGFRTEAAILSELGNRGYSVLVPWGANHRYDLVLDLEGEFVRAQCKTGWLREGSVVFPTRSIQCNSKRTVVRNYDGDADVFLVYCPDTDDVYCVPVEGAAKGYMSLRVEPTRNGQDKHVNWAADYLMPE